MEIAPFRINRNKGVDCFGINLLGLQEVRTIDWLVVGMEMGSIVGK